MVIYCPWNSCFFSVRALETFGKVMETLRMWIRIYNVKLAVQFEPQRGGRFVWVFCCSSLLGLHTILAIRLEKQPAHPSLESFTKGAVLG